MASYLPSARPRSHFATYNLVLLIFQHDFYYRYIRYRGVIQLLAFPLYALTKFLFSIFKHDLHCDEYAAARKDHEIDA